MIPVRIMSDSLPRVCARGLLDTKLTRALQVILGIVAWSLWTKKETGSGLPAGPSGILGAAEGFSYLSLAAGISVFALNAAGI